MAKETAPLERAAKYLCTVLDGLCPMAVEGYVCPRECDLDTVPWQCWAAYFRAEQERAGAERPA